MSVATQTCQFLAGQMSSTSVTPALRQDSLQKGLGLTAWSRQGGLVLLRIQTLQNQAEGLGSGERICERSFTWD